MISKIRAFFQLVRLKNLLITCFTQVFSYYFLSPHITLSDLSSPRFISLCIATIFVAAGGYIINDYLDIKLDLINKPEKVVVGQVISRRWTMLWHFILNGIAVILGLYIGIKVCIAIFSATILLWIYSVSLKRKFLVGNLLVSILSAFVIIINYVYDTSLDINLIIAYSSFAFALTLLREIIKDAEDIRGDGKFDCKTIPIVLGIRKTKSILFYLTFTFTALLFIYITLSAASFPFVFAITRGSFLFYMLLFVLLPLGVMIYRIRTADTTSDFSRLSSLAKIIMITGILSMFFWRL
jgi:4-hydroxybenzoate polyprenyltransferase